tara:strand:- start:3 stop:248 length:246 start_codon:yes stop_codon:yes gene_type:complete
MTLRIKDGMRMSLVLENTRIIESGTLVRHIETNEIGLLIKDEKVQHFCEVLVDGKVTKWFKNNIRELSNERKSRYITKYLA